MMQSMEIVIAGLYLIFVAQLVAQTSWRDLRAKRNRALLALVLVFVFCALTGYVAPALGVPMNFAIALHAVLIVATAVLVASNQAKTIAAMLADDNELA